MVKGWTQNHFILSNNTKYIAGKVITIFRNKIITVWPIFVILASNGNQSIHTELIN